MGNVYVFSRIKGKSSGASGLCSLHVLPSFLFNSELTTWISLEGAVRAGPDVCQKTKKKKLFHGRQQILRTFVISSRILSDFRRLSGILMKVMLRCAHVDNNSLRNRINF